MRVVVDRYSVANCKTIPFPVEGMAGATLYNFYEKAIKILDIVVDGTKMEEPDIIILPDMDDWSKFVGGEGLFIYQMPVEVEMERAKEDAWRIIAEREEAYEGKAASNKYVYYIPLGAKRVEIRYCIRLPLTGSTTPVRTLVIERLNGALAR